MESGVITPEVLADDKKPLFGLLMDKDDEKIMWNHGIRNVLEFYPDCPIKPVPYLQLSVLSG